jgi:hypothetical protein
MLLGHTCLRSSLFELRRVHFFARIGRSASTDHEAASLAAPGGFRETIEVRKSAGPTVACVSR